MPDTVTTNSTPPTEWSSHGNPLGTAPTFTVDANPTFSGTVAFTGALSASAGLTVSDGGIVSRAGGRIMEALSSTTNTTAANYTYTAAELVGGIIERDPNGGARTDVTDTGTNIETELNAQNGYDVANNDVFTCLLVNTADAAEAITLSGGTGVTIANAGQTIGQNESAWLIFRRTAANTYRLIIVGA